MTLSLFVIVTSGLTSGLEFEMFNLIVLPSISFPCISVKAFSAESFDSRLKKAYLVDIPNCISVMKQKTSSITSNSFFSYSSSNFQDNLPKRRVAYSESTFASLTPVSLKASCVFFLETYSSSFSKSDDNDY